MYNVLHCAWHSSEQAVHGALYYFSKSLSLLWTGRLIKLFNQDCLGLNFGALLPTKLWAFFLKLSKKAGVFV